MQRSPEQEFLMGGGGPKSAFNKFDAPGSVKGGDVIEWRYTQQTDMKTGDPKFWRDGNKAMQLEVTIQTDARDPAIENDDGRRRLFVKGEMTKAVRAAVQAAGKEMIEQGGKLFVQYTGDADPAGPGLDGAKLYAAHYTPAPVGFGTTDPAAGLVMSTPEPAPAAPTPAPAAPAAGRAFPVPPTTPPVNATTPMMTASPNADEAAAVAALTEGGLLARQVATAPAAPAAPAATPAAPPDLMAALAALSPEERAQMGLPPA